MTARNDITGDAIKSRTSTKKFRDNYDRIFNKKANQQLPQHTPSK